MPTYDIPIHIPVQKVEVPRCLLLAFLQQLQVSGWTYLFVLDLKHQLLPLIPKAQPILVISIELSVLLQLCYLLLSIFSFFSVITSSNFIFLWCHSSHSWLHLNISSIWCWILACCWNIHLVATFAPSCLTYVFFLFLNWNGFWFWLQPLAFAFQVRLKLIQFSFLVLCLEQCFINVVSILHLLFW